VLPGQSAALEAFDVTVGRRAGRVSYIEAPTRCSGPGWPFSLRADLEGGLSATDTRTISCRIRAQ
jgi:ribosomal protein L37E